MKRNILIILFSLFFSSQSLAWTTVADFESGTVGKLAEGTSGFDTSRDETFFSTDYARNGSKSARAGITAGGSSGMGGTFFFGSTPGEGDQLWWTCSVYFPPGFNFSVGGAGLKLFRLEVQSGSGDSEGFHNILMDTGGFNLNSQVSGSTFTANNAVRSGVGGAIKTGKWYTIEMFMKFSASRGIWRIWKDGNLVFEDTKTNTLRTSSSSGKRALMFTYWNDGAPATQAAYIDDCILTSETPANRDAHGNPFIGVGDFEYVADPNPPALF